MSLVLMREWKRMQTRTSMFDSLSSAQYANLTTFRRNGTAVSTPVWFAIYEPTGTVYLETGVNAGKVKRILHTPQVTLAQCTANGKVTGETIEGQARVVTDTEEIFRARGALHRKYGFRRQAIYSIMYLIDSIRRTAEWERAYIAIDLMEK
jgi:PPOX class probable F420-dependent enzyme